MTEYIFDNPLTIDMLGDALKKVIADRGEDYVYIPADDGTPGGACFYGNAQEYPAPERQTDDRCIFGQAFHDLGIEYTSAWEHVSLSCILEELGLTNGTALEDAASVQAQQDSGEPYGVLLRGTVFE